MLGNSLYTSLQRRRESKPVDPDAELEASRKKHAEELALARKMEAEERKKRDGERRADEARQAAMTRSAVTTLKPSAVDAFVELTAARDVRAATAWYYIDTTGKKQGSFAPKQMADWYLAGYLPRHLRVAPVFADDEAVPTDMRRIDELFDEPLHLTAFRGFPSSDDAAPVPKKKRKTDGGPSSGNWLQDSINRQKAGIHRKRHDRFDGPAMVFDGGTSI